MTRVIPEKLTYFLKNATKDVEDGFEYASELNRILHSDCCQTSLSSKEIELLREYADKVKSVGEINHYTEERIQKIEQEVFGSRGILGFLDADKQPKLLWPF